MASYPSRHYEEGKSPIQIRSMNHNCYLSNFGILKQKIGKDAWDHLKDSSIGVFLKLYEEKYIWSAWIVHYFLANQLQIESNHEFWSIIDGQPLRFSLHEFEGITGLNCYPFDPVDNWDADHSQFWQEMKISTAGGPSLDELKMVLYRCQDWSFEKRMMVGRLFILHVGIFGINHQSRLKLSSAKRVLDSEKFENYPWGRVGFSSLIGSIKLVTYKENSYTLHGCVHVLLMWVFESVPGLGELYGFKRAMTQLPALLHWQGCRTRFKFEDFIRDEKAAYGEVRVRYMLPVALKDVYPKWSDVDEKTPDPRLQKLIEDIIDDRLDRNAWPWSMALVEKDKKKKKGEENARLLLHDLAKSGAKKKKIKRNEDSKDSAMVVGIIKMLQKSVNKLEAKMTTIDARVGSLEKKVETMEKSIKQARTH